jgi:hypothetical protein
MTGSGCGERHSAGLMGRHRTPADQRGLGWGLQLPRQRWCMRGGSAPHFTASRCISLHVDHFYDAPSGPMSYAESSILAEAERALHLLLQLP